MKQRTEITNLPNRSFTVEYNGKKLEMLDTLKVNAVAPEVHQELKTYDIESSKQDTHVNYNIIDHQQHRHKKFEHFLFIMSVCILIVAFGFAIWSLL